MTEIVTVCARTVQVTKSSIYSAHIRHFTSSKSVSQAAVWVGWGAHRRAFCLQRSSRHNSGRLRPLTMPLHTKAHTPGQWSEPRVGGWNGPAEVTHLHASGQDNSPPTPPKHTQTQPPYINSPLSYPAFKRCCRCLPVFSGPRGSREILKAFI